jgi:hypothetical protein
LATSTNIEDFIVRCYEGEFTDFDFYAAASNHIAKSIFWKTLDSATY